MLQIISKYSQRKLKSTMNGRDVNGFSVFYNLLVNLPMKKRKVKLFEAKAIKDTRLCNINVTFFFLP